MQYKDFVKDFAERTIENYQSLKDTKYEVTQLINSSVALLIIPEQWYFDEITKNIQEQLPFEQLKNCIKENKYESEYKKTTDMKFICIRMRNAVSHGHIYPQAENGNIKSIMFCDTKEIFKTRKQTNNYMFVIDIPITLLEKFYISFSKVLINESTEKGNK